MTGNGNEQILILASLFLSPPFFLFSFFFPLDAYTLSIPPILTYNPISILFP